VTHDIVNAQIFSRCEIGLEDARWRMLDKIPVFSSLSRSGLLSPLAISDVLNNGKQVLFALNLLKLY